MKSHSDFESKLISSKKVALDSNIFIYLLERNDEYFSLVRQIFQLIEDEKISCLTSLVSVLEVLSSPKLTNSSTLATYKNFFSKQTGLTVYDITWEVMEKAAEFRRRFLVTSPDALQFATASIYRAELFVTNDKVFQKFKNIGAEPEIYFLS